MTGDLGPGGVGPAVYFLGTVTPREDVDRLARQDRYLHAAANELQWCYVEALRSQRSGGLKVFAAPAVSEYPRFPRVLVSARRLGLRRDGGIRFIPFVNVMGVKQVTQVISIVVTMLPIVWRRRRERAVVLVYSLQTPFLAAAMLVRRLAGVRVVAIIPDLTEFMDVAARRRGIRAFLKSLDVRLGRRLLERLDGAIVIARAIATDRLPASTPSLVVDSIRAVTTGAGALEGAEDGRRSILYTGALEAGYGLETLLAAFSSLEGPGYELWFAGKGGLEGHIRERAATDPRIRLLGLLPVAEIRATQARASLLVSVKPSQAPFTKYSFPSKLTEYVAAGRPVASTVCPGIEEEYFRFVHRLDDESPEAMRRSIEAIFRMDPGERQRRVREGVAFLRETRSPAARGRELMTFLGGL